MKLAFLLNVKSFLDGLSVENGVSVYTLCSHFDCMDGKYTNFHLLVSNQNSFSNDRFLKEYNYWQINYLK